jgi:hypothetical protein
MEHVGTGSGVSSPSGDRAAQEWVKAHAELSELARRRATLDWEEGTALLRAYRSGAHRHLGYASFAEYIERLFGYKPRVTEEKLRAAQALESLPEMNRALRDGELTWSAARELTRVATPRTEREWLGAAFGKTVRQVERLVSGRKLGDRPGDPPRPEARRHVLHFDVSAETFATFREAVAHLRRKSEQPLDDDALLLLMAREILQGPSDEGRASYQLAVTTCDRCAQGFQQGAGELLLVEPAIVDMVRCDAQELGRVADPHVGGRATQAIPPALRRRVMRRDRGRCVVSGCRHGTFLDVHHLIARSECGTHTLDNLITLCAGHHRALHHGRLAIEGTPSTGLVFRHADGSAFGTVIDAARSDVNQKVFSALTGQGFSEKQARAALARVSGNTEARTCEQVLRSTLLWLTRKPGDPV